MRIGLEKLDSSVFLYATLAIEDIRIDNNPDMEKVYECSELIFDLASERQTLDIEITMHGFLTRTKMVPVVCIYYNSGPCFEKLGDALMRVYLNPDKVKHGTLVALRENCLVLYRMFLNEQIGSRGRYRFVV